METFSHPILNRYVMYVTASDENQFAGISYEHSYTSRVLISYDYCGLFEHDLDSCPLLDRPHRLEALAAFNRELYLHNLLKINLG